MYCKHSQASFIDFRTMYIQCVKLGDFYEVYSTGKIFKTRY